MELSEDKGHVKPPSADLEDEAAQNPLPNQGGDQH